jgi:hypothetical protein
MKYAKYFAGFALAVGLLAAGTPTASAQDYWRYRAFERQDMRADYRRIGEMQERVARLRARLDEDRRCGRWQAARRDSMELARQEDALRYMMRDVRQDRRDYWR